MVDILDIFTADAFTSLPFHGNPAAICVTPNPLDQILMQQIAFEMNLSETAFIVPLNDSKISNASSFSLRWFTPKQEVRLCGHATLASAHILFSEYQYAQDILEFHTISGILRVQRENKYYTMDFPQNPIESYTLPIPILQSLHIPIESVITCGFSSTTRDLLIEISSSEFLTSISPDYSQLNEFTADRGIEGVIITARASSDSPYDFVSRFFAPALGINEDPVTGSAHTVLGPYWASKLKKKELKAYQNSPRGGDLRLNLSDQDRILISGNAVTLLTARLQLTSTLNNHININS